MKKIKSVLLAVIILMTTCQVYAKAADNSSAADAAYSEKYYKQACTLIKALTGELPEGEPAAAISRGEFADLLAKQCNLSFTKDNAESGTEGDFSDVGTDSPYYGSVKALREIGAISESDTFEPDRAISGNEALKMTVASAGYSYRAERKGGYPQGYLLVANDLGLTDNISVRGQLCFADAAIMMFNYMFADAVEMESIWEDNAAGKYAGKYSVGKNNYLSYYYGYDYIEGIVTETPYNSYDISHKIKDNDLVKINGSSYKCSSITADLLGKNVMAVYNENDEILCCWENKKNKEVTLYEINFGGIKDMYLKCADIAGKNSRYLLDSSYIVVYNGRRVSEITDEMTEDANGTITLLDNDSDGAYEVIKIETNVYGIIDTVDDSYNSISITEPNAMYINLDENVYYRINDNKGNPLEVFQLSKGMAVAVKASHDMRMVEVNVLDKTLSGTVTAFDESSGILEIDGVEYTMSEAFRNKHLSALKTGTSIDVILAGGDLIVCMTSGKDTLQYGFLQKFAYDKRTVSKKLQLKIYTASGKFETVGIKGKIMLNGVKGKTAEDVEKALGGAAFTPQVIRYKTTADGTLLKLDTAMKYNDYVAENPGYVFGDDLPMDNSLINYGSRPSSSSEYRSGFRGMVGFAHLSSTTIFAIPRDINDDEEYEIYSAGDLNNGVSYNWTLYDINLNGAAGAATIVKEINSVNRRKWTAMILEHVARGVNDDGEDIWIIRGWSNGSFVRYTIKDEVMNNMMDQMTVSLETKYVSVGDIISVDVSGDEVKNFLVDFEYSADNGNYTYVNKNGTDNRFFTNLSVAQNSKNQSYYGSAPLCYMEGYAYNNSSGRLFVGLSQEHNVADDSVFVYSNLRLSHASSRVVCFDRELKKLTPMSLNQINTYRGSGAEADFLILRNREDGNDAIFVIR